MNRCLVIILTLFVLTGCSGDSCIEADDFGHAVYKVSARYAKSEIGGQPKNQVAPWRDSGYKVNGRPLSITVKGWRYRYDRNNSSDLSAWCAWYGSSGDSRKLAKICARLRDCHFIDEIMCTETVDAQIDNAPCLFRNGVGAYALIAKKDPNLTPQSQRSPKGLSFHLAKPVDRSYEVYDFIRENGKLKKRILGGRIYNYKDQDANNYVNSTLYFKILDKFYDDNSGQYQIVVKSGIHRSNADPISHGIGLVKEYLFGDKKGLIKGIYLGIVNNPEYRTAVSALLTLYVMFTGLSYLAGNIQITQMELVIRISKIAIVSALLSTEHSWNFFNDYLFVYFIGGVTQIIDMIMSAGATGPGSSSIMALMLAPQTISKLLSLLFVDWAGFIYIILFFIALAFIMMVFFQAAVIYVTAIVAIGMIITMAPIFICFMLFGATRNLFDNWLKQLTSYAIQPIILFTGLALISMILRQEIYGSLGFRVCKKDFPKMTNADDTPVFGHESEEILGFTMKHSIFYWWFPDPMKGGEFAKETSLIPIPLDNFSKSRDGMRDRERNPESGFCEAYGCYDERYPDLPFLDVVKDRDRINAFQKGSFVQLDNLFIIFIAIYLLHKFNRLSISVARFISDTSGNYAELESVEAGVRQDIKQHGPGLVTRAADITIGKANRQKITALRDMAQAKIRSAGKKIYTKASAFVDKRRIRGLEQEAISSSPNKAVLSEIRKKSGLDLSKIKIGSLKKYQARLANELRNMDSNLTAKQVSKLASQMSGKKYSALKNEFAQAKYGMQYSALPENAKQQINTLHKDRALRDLAREAENVRMFQTEYIEAYARLSDKGIGLVGKKSRLIRSIEEIRHDAKERKKHKQNKQQQIGREIISEIEGIKHSAYSKLSGGREDALSLGVAGGAWHEINTDPKADNHRLQTQAEIIADQRLSTEREATARIIEDLSARHGTNVISPEFLAEAERNGAADLEKYQNLEREDLNNRLHLALTAKTDDGPVLMGEKYMQEYASDEQMKEIIDRIHETEEVFAQYDQFLSRATYYEDNLQFAEENLQENYAMLKDHYDRDNITAEEMPALLRSYYDEADDISPEDAYSKIVQLEESISEFSSSQETLQQIDHRREELAEETDQHIENVNKHRTDAGMEEYTPEARVELPVRRLRKIDDHLRNL